MTGIPPLEPLDPGVYRELVRRALAEDFGWGDVTTEGVIDRGQKARGVLVAKSRCVLAGLGVATETFLQMDPAVTVTTHRQDGDWCEPSTVVAEYGGYAAGMLTAERTALNFLQRLSGIATLTRQFVEAAGGRITVLDTRKTTPLLRALEKYAVRVGGGVNHRSGLDDAILIKDNHVAVAGGIRAVLERARAHAGHLVKIEIEVDSLSQLREVLDCGLADVVLIDNFGVADMKTAVAMVGGKLVIEASGGITLDTIPAIAATGVDYASSGALTHSAPNLDVGLDIEM